MNWSMLAPKQTDKHENRSSSLHRQQYRYSPYVLTENMLTGIIGQFLSVPLRQPSTQSAIQSVDFNFGMEL